MGGSPIRADVMSYFEKRPGQTVYLKDMAAELKLKEDSVQSSIGHMVRQDILPLEIVVRGQAWRYKPGEAKAAKAAARPLYELLGTAKDGALILEAEDGGLWRATEL